jgi:hypothetical protein
LAAKRKPTSGLTPEFLADWIGTAEAMPFHETIYENSGKLNQAGCGI